MFSIAATAILLPYDKMSHCVIYRGSCRTDPGTACRLFEVRPALLPVTNEPTDRKAGALRVLFGPI